MADQTGTPAPVTAGAIPWYQSADQKRRLVTFVLMIVTMMLPKNAIVHSLGLDDGTRLAVYVDNLADLMPVFIGLGSILLGWAKRFRSTLQPLTWSKAAAAVHPATLAVVATQAAMKEAKIPTSRVKQAEIEAAPTAAAVAAAVAPPAPPLTALDANAIADAAVVRFARAQQLARARASERVPPLDPLHPESHP